MHSWKRSFIALLIAQTFALIGFSIIQPIIPFFLMEDIGVTDPVQLKTWVGLLHAAPAFFMAIFAPIWGNLADIYSRRAMLLRAMLGGSIIMTFMAFVSTPWQFLLLRSIQGCITGTVAAATVLAVGIAPPGQVAFALGMLQAGIAVGNSLGPMIGGLLADFLSFRAAFFATGICLAIAGFIVLIWVKEEAKPLLREGDVKKFTLIPNFRPIADSPLLITILFISFGVSTATSVTIPMLPLFIRELVLSANGEEVLIASTVGLVKGVAAASLAIAAVLMGKLADRIGYWRPLIFCMAAGALFLVLQGLIVTTVTQLIILRVIASFFKGGALPLAKSIIAVSSEKEKQGVAYGVNSSVTAAGKAVGPMIGSSVAMLGLRSVFVASAAILALTSVVAACRRKWT